MHLIKVNAIDSTNSLAREKLRENPNISATCIWAEHQLDGRGQRGSSWSSHPGQNLTFSIIFPRPAVALDQQFLLSAVVSTAIINCLKKFNVPGSRIKWPNDIMTANYKMGGILIENVIAEGQLAASIIGIGLNVNQTTFENLPAASSLKLATGQHFSLDELLDSLVNAIEADLLSIADFTAEEILEKYKKHLFRLNRPSTFQLPDKSLFTGTIENVSLSGKLLVKAAEGSSKEFDLKEVKLCY